MGRSDGCMEQRERACSRRLHASQDQGGAPGHHCPGRAVGSRRAGCYSASLRRRHPVLPSLSALGRRQLPLSVVRNHHTDAQPGLELVMSSLKPPLLQAAPPARQRGVVLFIALIVMVALSLAAIALIRSVDTTTTVIGNLAFRQASILPANMAVEEAAAALFVDADPLHTAGS